MFNALFGHSWYLCLGPNAREDPAEARAKLLALLRDSSEEVHPSAMKSDR